MGLRLKRLVPVVLAVVTAGWVLARCAPPTDVLFLCEEDGGCVQRDSDGPYVCLEDGYCWPRSDVGPGGTDGGDGGPDGGGDGGPTDGGDDAGADAGDAAVPLVEIGPRCLTARVCAEHPISGGVALNGIWGTGDRDLWAVGDKGTALHWNGDRWQRVGFSATENARDVWGEGGRWYAVGDGMRLWWLDGGAFADIAVIGTANLVGVHGAGGQAYAVSDDGGILSIQGSNATPVPGVFPAQWRSVWSLGAGQTFAVGRNGKAARILSPTTVTDVSPAGMLVDFTDLGANAGGTLYAVGDAGEVWSYDTGAGQFVRLNAGGPGALAVAALDDGLWIAKSDAGEVGVYRLPGFGFDTVALPVSDWLRDAWASGQTTWMVGDHGTIIRNADGVDAGFSFAPGGETPLIRAIVSTPDGRMFAAGEAETLLERRGDQWLPLFDAGGPEGYRALFVGTGGLWTGGPAGIWRYGDGGMILEHATFGATVNALAGDERRPIYAVGKNGLALYYDGSGWTVLTTAAGNAELLGAACYPDGGNLWMVGDGGTVLQRLPDAGIKSHYIAGGSYAFYDVWISLTEPDVWLAGPAVNATHWDGGPGSPWDTMNSVTGEVIRSVDGARSDAMWIVGGNGIVFWDGGVMAHSNVPGLNLVTVHVADGGMWAGGTNGLIVHQSEPP